MGKLSASETCRWSSYLTRSGDARIWHLQKIQLINLVFMPLVSEILGQLWNMHIIISVCQT